MKVYGWEMFPSLWNQEGNRQPIICGPLAFLNLFAPGIPPQVMCLPQAWDMAHSLHFPATSPSVTRDYQTRILAELGEVKAS